MAADLIQCSDAGAGRQLLHLAAKLGVGGGGDRAVGALHPNLGGRRTLRQAGTMDGV